MIENKRTWPDKSDDTVRYECYNCGIDVRLCEKSFFISVKSGIALFNQGICPECFQSTAGDEYVEYFERVTRRRKRNLEDQFNWMKQYEQHTHSTMNTGSINPQAFKYFGDERLDEYQRRAEFQRMQEQLRELEAQAAARRVAPPFSVRPFVDPPREETMPPPKKNEDKSFLEKLFKKE